MLALQPQLIAHVSRALFIIFIIIFVSTVVGAGHPNSQAKTLIEGETGVAKENLSTYHWNLHDEALPLISLPDHLGGNLDFTLTYSLGEFQLPLFQTLYFNEQARNYILMVMVSGSRQLEFIVLNSVGTNGQFQARDGLDLELLDRGEEKVLSSKGVNYTFARYADGELHCSRIDDSSGVQINLEYDGETYLHTIADEAGRKIAFNYTDQYLSSVTQIWGGTKLKQTWAVTDRDTFARRPAPNALRTRKEHAKFVPSNALKPGYTDAMAASDLVLAEIFGGPGAVAAANSFEPRRLAARYPLYRGDQIADDGRLLRGHLSYAMHLYGSEDGTGETDIYIPAGFTLNSTIPTPTDAAISFYYPRLGQLTDVTLVVFHINDFRISAEGGRVRIGRIGGPGGSNPEYKHSHMEFYQGDTGLPGGAARARLRIEPASVFAGEVAKYATRILVSK